MAALATTSLTVSTVAQETYALKLGHTGAPNHHFQEISERFAELVSERTDGAVKIEVFPSDSLGKQVELVEGTFLGTTDMVLTSDAVLSNFAPEIGIVNLPFIFRDSDHVRAVLDGEIGEQLSAKVEEQGATVLAWWENGFRHITNSKRPIETSADVAGLKLRVPEGPVFVDTFTTLGANATPIAFTELYSALQLGVVDGQENPPAHILTQKFYEVQDFASKTAHIYLSSPLLVSNIALERLPEEYRTVLKTTAKELAPVHTAMVLEAEAKQWEEIAAAGMAINEVDKAPFVEATRPVIEKYRGQFGPEIIDAIIANGASTN
ncbi:TRAP transporter substrate-binding protein [Fulvimarina sp. 2208YS6-2-32]|uniref:TRAP transporter substrate-binding protein n=1 Tax=Fulvimarina uroteuthidis TaxID=3098149 RepID=A0ABU5I035_9HYPH|nr:TRAP transporter substrate-binding protein [Fulvimarina sp. 2208YS6-2-32]